MTDEDKEIFNTIKRYSDMGRLSVFVGAGVSKLSGCPSWNELIHNMSNEICYEGSSIFSTDELLKIPLLYRHIKKDEQYYNKILSEFDGEYKPNIIHHLIFSLYPNHILTTNYDNLLEDTAIELGRNFSKISSNSEVSKVESLHYLIKVHGDFSEHKDGTRKFVLMEQDYLDFERDYILIDSLVKTIFSTDLVMFIGYGLGDYNIKLILNWVRTVQDNAIKPIFIHAGEKLKELDRMYYQLCGLRVIDSNDYIQEPLCNNIYLQRYETILNKIKDFDGSNNQKNNEGILQYLYDHISGIKNLNYICRKDFEELFKNKYVINENWEIENKSDDNCWKIFFENEGAFKNINLTQYEVIRKFLNRIGIRGITVNKKSSSTPPKLTIQSTGFKAQYSNMYEECTKRPSTLKQIYNKAYYYTQLGEYVEGYKLYTQLIKEANEEKQWDLYYLSLINRWYLWKIIYQMYMDTTGVSGITKYGRELKILDQDTIDYLNQSIRGQKLENLFQELPYKFRTKYKFLDRLSNSISLNQENFDFINFQWAIKEKSGKFTWSRYLLEYDKSKIEMLETSKFLYENKILITQTDEYKLYVKSVILIWLQGYYEEIKKIKFNYFKDNITPHLSFTLQDIVLIFNTFTERDVRTLKENVNISLLPFEEIDLLINFITEQLHFNKQKYQNLIILKEAKDILLKEQESITSKYDQELYFWKEYSKRLKVLILVSSDLIKNKENKLNKEHKLNLVKEILESPFNDRDKEDIIYNWLNSDIINEIIPIVEQWIIEKFDYIKSNTDKEDREALYYDMELTSRPFKKFYQENLNLMEKLSNYIIENKNKDFLQIRYIITLYPFLTKKGKTIIKELYYFEDDKITSLTKIDQLLQLNGLKILPDFIHKCEEKKVVDNFLKEKIKEKEKDLKLDNYSEKPIGEVAYYMLQRNFPSEIVNKYVNNFNIYDFILAPEKFNVDNFQDVWFFIYSPEMFKKLAENKIQREIIINAINRMIDEKRYNAEETRTLFKIYQLVNE